MNLVFKLAMECIVYCGIFFGLVKLSVPRSPLTAVFWYPKEVQERIYSLGLADEQQQKKKGYIFMSFFMVIIIAAAVLMVGVFNRPESYWSGYGQLVLILSVSVWFDKIALDTIWVGTDFWRIPGTEDLQVKKPLKVRIMSCIFTPLVYAVLALPLTRLIPFIG